MELQQFALLVHGAAHCSHTKLSRAKTGMTLADVQVNAVHFALVGGMGVGKLSGDSIEGFKKERLIAGTSSALALCALHAYYGLKKKDED
jgi:hypothetical protein